MSNAVVYDGPAPLYDELTPYHGWSTAGPWGSTGTLRGDTLVVRYNVVMMLTDFIDGDYVLSR